MVQAFFAAREAVGDVAGICERKPDVCETGKAAFHTIGARARESARIAIGMLEDNPGEPDTVTTPAAFPPSIDRQGFPRGASKRLFS